MIRSQLKDGVHYDMRDDLEVTAEERQLMQTQDIQYIQHKRVFTHLRDKSYKDLAKRLER